MIHDLDHDAGGCNICGRPDFALGPFCDRTMILCDQCECEFHVGCLRKAARCDLSQLPTGQYLLCVTPNAVQARKLAVAQDFTPTGGCPCLCMVAPPTASATSATVPQCLPPAFMPDPVICVSAWHEPFVSFICSAGAFCAASNCMNHICHCSGQAVCNLQMHKNHLETSASKTSLGAAATADCRS